MKIVKKESAKRS